MLTPMRDIRSQIGDTLGVTDLSPSASTLWLGDCTSTTWTTASAVTCVSTPTRTWQGQQMTLTVSNQVWLRLLAGNELSCQL